MSLEWLAFRWVFGALLAGLVAPPLGAAMAVPTPSRSPPSPVLVTLADSPADNQYRVHASFETPVGPEAVWAVLSDYGNLAHIVDGLESSRVLERKGDDVLLEQVMRGHFLFFGRSLVLRLAVKEGAHRFIGFLLLGPGPFKSYQGSWTVTPLPSGSRVDYLLNVSRGDLAPQFFERKMFKDSARSLLEALKTRIEARAAAPPAPPKP